MPVGLDLFKRKLIVLLSGDEVLEVNGLKVKGKSVHDICDTLCQMTGTLTFVIVPGPGNARLLYTFTQMT